MSKQNISKYETNEQQYAFFPIKDPQLFKYRQMLIDSRWRAEEAINEDTIPKDKKHWKQITDAEKQLIKYILAFFAVGDGVVNEKIGTVVLKRVTHHDWISFECQKIAQEDIHNHTYSLLVDIYIDDPKERKEMLESVENYPSIALKKNWFDKYFDETELIYLPQKDIDYLHSLGNIDLNAKLASARTQMAQILLLMIVMEGIFFSSSFCIIYWFKERGLFPALSKANGWIARDEGTHTDVNIYIYNTLSEKLESHIVHKIISESVDIECKFISDAIPSALIGINAPLVHQYVKYVADSILQCIGYETLYNVVNPFAFMNKITLDRNTDFFHDKVEDYSTNIEFESLTDLQIDEI